MLGQQRSSPIQSIAKSIPDISRIASPRPKFEAESSRHIDNETSKEIEERVQVAAKKFEVLQGNIAGLIEALKAQHKSIKTLDEDRLKTAKQMEVLLADTPIAPVIASAKTNLEERATATDASDDDDSLTATTVKTMVALVKRTYLELHKQQYDSVLSYAKTFDERVVSYAEEWLEVISARVSSNVIQFKELSDSLEHYNTKVEKLKAHQKPNMSKPSPKLERNETKLRGTRESHDTMGENLYKLMEEVTVRAWKDLLPLLMQSIQMDLTQAEEERRVIWDDLQTVLEALEVISAQHGVTTEGRLQRLKKDHIDVLYTGTHSSHRTQVVKPPGGLTPPLPTTIKTVDQEAPTVKVKNSEKDDSEQNVEVGPEL
jgi:hypothetical protein